MNPYMNLCNFDPDVRHSHKLVVVKWKYSDNGKCITSQHATQLMCTECFNLFDFQAISDFHVEQKCKCEEIANAASCKDLTHQEESNDVVKS